MTSEKDCLSNFILHSDPRCSSGNLHSLPLCRCVQILISFIWYSLLFSFIYVLFSLSCSQAWKNCSPFRCAIWCLKRLIFCWLCSFKFIHSHPTGTVSFSDIHSHPHWYVHSILFYYSVGTPCLIRWHYSILMIFILIQWHSWCIDTSLFYYSPSTDGHFYTLLLKILDTQIHSVHSSPSFIHSLGILRPFFHSTVIPFKLRLPFCSCCCYIPSFIHSFCSLPSVHSLLLYYSFHYYYCLLLSMTSCHWLFYSVVSIHSDVFIHSKCLNHSSIR